MARSAPPRFSPQLFDNEPYVKRIEKPWGYELHFTKPDKPFMLKLMHIEKGKRTSLQAHDCKQETYLVINGDAGLIWEDESGELITIMLRHGQGYTTQVGQKHRLFAITDIDIIEGSTPEYGTTWRYEDDYDRPDETPTQRKRERSEL